MRQVEYLDVPRLCDELLDEVERTRVTIEIVKDGRPIARMEPVDEAARAVYKEGPVQAVTATDLARDI